MKQNSYSPAQKRTETALQAEIREARSLLETKAHYIKCRNSLPYWARHVLREDYSEAGKPPLSPAPCHEILHYWLNEVAEGRVKKLMVFQPPGSAKSTNVSQIYPPWHWAKNPTHCIIGASNTQTLADSFSKRVQYLCTEHRLELGFEPIEQNPTLWNTTGGGRYLSAGVGGTITGFRADLAIIDDPFRSREDAYSETIREKIRGWFNTDLNTRIKPGGSVILMHTRWHVDDLAGQLLEEQAEDWVVVNLPAIWEEEAPEPAFPWGMGRSKGDLLWPEYHDKKFYEDARKLTGERDFQALYQQKPTVQEGSLIQIDKLFRVPFASLNPAAETWRHWDLAATASYGTKRPDWTVGVKMQRNADDGRWIVVDVVRFQGEPAEVERRIMETARRDGYGVKISLPIDAGGAGKIATAGLVRMLAGWQVFPERENGDKVVRATPMAAQINAGNIGIVSEGTWQKAFVEELAMFPGGRYDDQVDAAANAFYRLIIPVTPVRRTTWGRSFHMGR